MAHFSPVGRHIVDRGRAGRHKCPEPLAALLDLAFGENALGRFRDNTEYASRRALIIGDNRVGNVEGDSLAATAMALDVEGPVSGCERLPRLANAAQKRSEIIPQLGPA